MTSPKPIKKVKKPPKVSPSQLGGSWDTYVPSPEVSTFYDQVMGASSPSPKPSGFTYHKYKPAFSVTKVLKQKSEPMDRNKIYNKPLLEAFPYLQNKKQEGEIGLEIECEGMNLFNAPISWWGTHVDHSLRPYKDHPPIEYVLRKPISRNDVPKALTYLSRKLKEVGSNVVDSHRTSVHVHVNCQQMTFKEVTQYWGLYAIFEELLVEFSGPDRRGNLFCLRAKDAEHFIQVYESCLQQEDFDDIFSKDLRYTACNMASIGKFGSIEFRSMRGTVDQELIQLWIDILLLIRDKALEYRDPQDIVKDFEKYGPELFLKKITASRLDIYNLLQNFPDYKQKMWDGLRLMRDVAYAIKWEERDENLVEKNDPVEEEKPLNPEEPSAGIEEYPQEIKPGVWVVQSGDRFFLINYNFNYTAVQYKGAPWGLKGRMAFEVSTVTGKYLDSKRPLEGHEYPPGHPLHEPFEWEDVPPEPEEEPDFETETMNEDQDDEY